MLCSETLNFPYYLVGINFFNPKRLLLFNLSHKRIFFLIFYPSMYIFIVYYPIHLCFYFDMLHFFFNTVLQLVVSQMDKNSRSCSRWVHLMWSLHLFVVHRKAMKVAKYGIVLWIISCRAWPGNHEWQIALHFSTLIVAHTETDVVGVICEPSYKGCSSDKLVTEDQSRNITTVM